jgi:hypothetical protein
MQFKAKFLNKAYYDGFDEYETPDYRGCMVHSAIEYVWVKR